MNCSISAAPLTDHCMIKLTLTPTDTCRRNKGYWKFNSNLLKHDPFCQDFQRIIEEITKDSSLSTYREKWELHKYKIRQISIAYSKTLSVNKKKLIL